jgi:hypothetical protein
MNEELKYVYIQEVIKYLPNSQKKDIEKELDTIIEDQLANENMSLEDVLIELGHPRDLAYGYLEDDHPYVIGPRFKESYFNTLKYVLPIVAMAIASLNILALIFQGEKTFLDFMSSIFNSAFISFTYITVGFIIAEKVINQKETKDNWHPNKLDLSKYREKPYKKSNIWSGLIVVTILIALFNVFPELIGVHSITTNEHIHFIDLDHYSKYQPWINVAFVLLMLRLFIRFFVNKHNKTAMIVSISLHFIASFILVITFLSPGLINPRLTLEFADMNFPEIINYEFIYNLFRIIAGVVIIVFSVDSYKDYRDVY